MKPSYYNLFFPFDDSYILFNTLRGPILLVDADVKTILEKGDISSLDPEYTELFETSGILVEDKLNERDEVRLLYERSKYTSPSTSLHVITTYNCNLACIYCYEGKGELEHKRMDEKTAQCVIKFIKDLTVNSNDNMLSLELFGGEPLLNMPINLMVVKELSRWCNEYSKMFSINTITNGTLSTEQTVEELAQYDSSFLVTVDGPKKIHDQSRIYKNGKGTFDDIIEGLGRVKDHGLGTMVRINVDETNKDHIVSLFQFLKDAGLGHVKISIKSVFNTTAACMSYSFCMSDLEGLKVTNELYRVARTMNFLTEELEKPGPKGACCAHQDSYFTIDPHLKLFKCAILAPYEKNAVGYVDLERAIPVFNYLNTDFLSRDILGPEECRDCKIVPMCRGGCPAEIFETHGTTHSYVCRKPGFMKTLERNLTTYVKRFT